MVGRKEGLFGGRERGMVGRKEGWNKRKYEGGIGIKGRREVICWL